MSSSRCVFHLCEFRNCGTRFSTVAWRFRDPIGSPNVGYGARTHLRCRPSFFVAFLPVKCIVDLLVPLLSSTKVAGAGSMWPLRSLEQWISCSCVSCKRQMEDSHMVMLLFVLSRALHETESEIETLPPRRAFHAQSLTHMSKCCSNSGAYSCRRAPLPCARRVGHS